MKFCPQCNKTYDDDNLNFCLEDGTVLNQANVGSGQRDLGETLQINRQDTASRKNDPPETVMINPAANQQQNAGFNQGFGNVQQNQPNWGANSQTVQPVKKSSKSWIWVLGILGVLAVVCGGGLIGFIALIPGNDNTNWNADFGKNSVSNTTNSRSNPGNSASPNAVDKGETAKIEMKNWVKGDNDLGFTEFNDGEFFMNAKKENYYYVIAAPKQYGTENATTRVSIRNVDSAKTNLGFGLIIHSDPTPLQKDYAFLIDTDKQRFRLVRHTPKTEIVVSDWTNSDVIKTGSDENVLEVRDDGSKMDFYINGLKVTSQTNVFGFRGGVVGVYTGIDKPIAFSDLEIKK